MRRFFWLRTLTLAVLLLACLLVGPSWLRAHFYFQDEIPAPAESADSNQSQESSTQELLEFEMLVRDTDGNPIAGAKIKPWAVYSSLGHGPWGSEPDGLHPEEVTTDSGGRVTLKYPRFHSADEQVRTLVVTASVEHPDYPVVTHVDVAVPRSKPFKYLLPPGSAIEGKLQCGEAIQNPDEIRAVISGGRTASSVMVTETGEYRIPPIQIGSGEFMFVRIKDKKITHFSPIEKVDIDGESPVVTRDVKLVPAIEIRGRLSDDVPRPVKNGRIRCQTISTGKSWDSEIDWSDWAPVDEAGNFLIESWPVDSPLQLIALCDGFVASPGEKPPMVTPERARGNYYRPQVFLKPGEEKIMVQMEPLIAIDIVAKNAFGKPLPEVNVNLNPNVGWWHGGSQIYCSPLYSSKDGLIDPDYDFMKDAYSNKTYPEAFQGITDNNGHTRIDVPVDRHSLSASNKRFQMPVKVGQRYVRVVARKNHSMRIDLVLQPIGLDILGDWEDLCGLVFG